MTTPDEQAGRLLAEALQAEKGNRGVIEAAYQQLDNAGLLSKVVVHRYLCRRGCGVVATVVKLGAFTLARTRDYKYSPGKNSERSVASARRKNTLDGDRHWPGHTFDVGQLAELGPQFGMDAHCRHTLTTLFAADVLEKVRGVRPGHPGKPTLL